MAKKETMGPFTRQLLRQHGQDPTSFGDGGFETVSIKANVGGKKKKAKKRDRTQHPSDLKPTEIIRPKAPVKRLKIAVTCPVCKTVHKKPIVAQVPICSQECFKTYYITTQKQLRLGWTIANSLRAYAKACDEGVTEKRRVRPWQAALQAARDFGKTKKYTNGERVISLKKMLRQIRSGK